MRQTQKIFGSLHSRAYVKNLIFLVLAVGTGQSLPAAPKSLVSSKVEVVQQNTVTMKGTVVDENGYPIIGASVVEKGTHNGTVTDLDGNYSLTVKHGAYLTISYLGYVSQTTMGGKVHLKPSDTDLDEVVVVGFGTQKKVNLTGAVAAVSGAELENRPVSNATQALQGLVAGLQITQSSGSLNDTPNINVRGATTIGQGSSGNPLVLIDGMEGDINTVNPQDIANVSILKDAAASSIYGSRAPFGVILITTKSGTKNGKISINYNNNFRFSLPIRMKHSMSSVDFACMQNDAYVNGGQGAVFTPERVQKMKAYMEGEYVGPGTRRGKDGNLIYSLEEDPNNPGYWASGFTEGNDCTDFYKEIYKTHTFSQEHNISASGGSNKLNYYASFGYLGQDGLIKIANEGSHRYTATAKITSEWTEWLRFNYSMRFIRKDYHKPQSLSDGLYEYLGGQWPNVPLYDRNGYLNQEQTNTLRNGGQYKYQNDQYNHQVGLDIEPIKKWITHAIFNYRTYHDESHTDQLQTFVHDVKGNAYLQNEWSYVGEDYYKENYSNFQFYSEYTFDLSEKHNFHVMAGFQSEDERMTYKYADRNGIIVSNKPEIDITTGLDPYGSPVTPSVGGNRSRWTTCGFFGRINYDYNSKYLLEMNGRYDGSSRFRHNNQWKFFPSVSVGWNIANEKIMQPVNDWIGLLKLRISYGSLGNQNVDDIYQTFQRIAVNPSAGQWLQNGIQPNVALAPSLVSESLTWETIRNFNIGLDFALLKERLRGSFDWYVRKTKNMIGPAPELPSVLGTGVPVTNNTDLRTNGWELTIGWSDRLKNGFSYGININLSDAYGTITRYPNNPSHSLGSYIEGQHIGDIYGFETIGIAKTQAEMNGHLKNMDQSSYGSNWGAGDIMYADLNGDKKMSAGAYTLEDHGDLEKIGNNTPRYLFGIDMNAAWKGFDFRVFFQGVMKRDYWVSPRYLFGTFGHGRWYTICIDGVQDYFRDENSWSVVNGFKDINTDSYLPRAAYSNKNEQVQTRYLQNAAYIRLKNLQIGYTLPQSLTRKWFIEKCRIFFSGENLWTGTSLLKQYDPETLGTWHGNGYPLSSTYSFGISVTL